MMTVSYVFVKGFVRFDGLHLFVLVQWPVSFSVYHYLFGVSLSFACVLSVMLSFAVATSDPVA